MHRDGRDRQEAVGIAGEHVDLHLVERAAYGGTHFVVRNLDGEKAERRIDDRKIETKFRKTLMEQLREHRGRKVLRMAGRPSAPRSLLYKADDIPVPLCSPVDSATAVRCVGFRLP